MSEEEQMERYCVYNLESRNVVSRGFAQRSREQEIIPSLEMNPEQCGIHWGDARGLKQLPPAA